MLPAAQLDVSFLYCALLGRRLQTFIIWNAPHYLATLHSHLGEYLKESGLLCMHIVISGMLWPELVAY